MFAADTSSLEQASRANEQVKTNKVNKSKSSRRKPTAQPRHARTHTQLHSHSHTIRHTKTHGHTHTQAHTNRDHDKRSFAKGWEAGLRRSLYMRLFLHPLAMAAATHTCTIMTTFIYAYIDSCICMHEYFQAFLGHARLLKQFQWGAVGKIIFTCFTIISYFLICTFLCCFPLTADACCFSFCLTFTFCFCTFFCLILTLQQSLVFLVVARIFQMEIFTIQCE